MDLSLQVLSDLVITGIRSIHTMYNEQGCERKRADRPRWALLMKYEGETRYICNGKSYISDKNHIFILPKGSSYEWMCTKSGHYTAIEFECDRSHSEILPFYVPNAEKMLKMFKELEYKQTLKTPLYTMECLKGTYDMLLTLINGQAAKYTPSNKSEKIKPAIDYIAQRYHTNIKNDELAALTNCSTVYFRKLFAEIMGVSPIAYIHSLRIKKAKEMLQSDYGSITDIALSLGYPNIYDFSRDFKKHTGVSPSHYLKSGAKS
ncbi:MAG: helix-turn-helix transcriptional regulator [Clostridia bacterium]|nr:helix-turn-helix transcriptional regulator [Clostridia bacterium]